MKAFIPYALLGIIGVTGAVAGKAAMSSTSQSTAPTLTKPMAMNGSVRVTASLDRTALPTLGGEAFVRVALEGVMPNEQKHDRVPVSLTLVIDRSGSMGGPKMDDAKKAALFALASLQPGDKACVVSFDQGAEDHGCVDVATVGGTGSLPSAVEALSARGGTDMVSGLRVGGDAANKIHDGGRINRLMLLSDGRPDTEAGLRQQVTALAQRGITTTTLGLGEDYNEDLMAGLADAGLGKYYFVEKPEQLVSIFNDELKSLATVVAHQAVVSIEPKDGVIIDDVIGFRFDHSGSKVIIPAGDIYGGRVTDILVRIHAPQANGMHDVVAAHVTYLDVKKNATVAEDRTLAALFTKDMNAVTASLVPEVAVKAEKWHAAQAVLEANAAYDRGDKTGGDTILQGSTVRLNASAASLAAPELAAEAKENDSFKAKNDAGGDAWRGVGTKVAKKRAWSMNKGSAYQ